jgi:hypothetical protein
MSACAAQVFSNVSSSAWSCLKQKAAAEGYPIGSDAGSQTQQGFTIEWQYDSGAQTLTITCTDSPFWAPCGTSNSKIHEVVDGTGCLA